VDAVVELLVEVFGELLFEVGASLVTAPLDGRLQGSAGGRAARLLGYILLGVLAGALSAWLFHGRWLDPAWAKAWLALSPLVGGTVFLVAHRLRRGDWKAWWWVEGATFALALTLVRFIATRPAV